MKVPPPSGSLSVCHKCQPLHFGCYPPQLSYEFLPAHSWIPHIYPPPQVSYQQHPFSDGRWGPSRVPVLPWRVFPFVSGLEICKPILISRYQRRSLPAGTRRTVGRLRRRRRMKRKRCGPFLKQYWCLYLGCAFALCQWPKSKSVKSISEMRFSNQLFLLKKMKLITLMSFSRDICSCCEPNACIAN